MVAGVPLADGKNPVRHASSDFGLSLKESFVTVASASVALPRLALCALLVSLALLAAPAAASAADVEVSGAGGHVTINVNNRVDLEYIYLTEFVGTLDVHILNWHTGQPTVSASGDCEWSETFHEFDCGATSSITYNGWSGTGLGYR